MSARYAIYFAPAAGHPLWAAGCRWLGRDPESGATHDVASHRSEPRRYGFHATLKAPFSLRDSASEASLLAALSHFAHERASFEMPALRVATLGDFIALRPIDREAGTAGRPLRLLADDCVRMFDPFRRPASAGETSRRLQGGLDDGQRTNVARWGYPHVFEHWRFHMTLTDSLGRDAAGQRCRAQLLGAASRDFSAALAEPLRCEGIALFLQETPGADFRVLQRFGFAR